MARSSLEVRRNYELNKLYGITLLEYNSMLETQDNRCSICNTHTSDEDKNFSVDHCHTTGKVRGLLCTKCNLGLGLLKDNIDTIDKCISYLKRKHYE